MCTYTPPLDKNSWLIAHVLFDIMNIPNAILCKHSNISFVHAIRKLSFYVETLFGIV